MSVYNQYFVFAFVKVSTSVLVFICSKNKKKVFENMLFIFKALELRMPEYKYV